MRLALLLLLLANLAFVAWQVAMRDQPRRGHEPERLAQQIRPEALRPLAPGSETLLCRRLAGLDTTQAQALAQAFGTRPGALVDLIAVSLTEHAVLIGGLAGEAQVTKKKAELRALGIDATEVVAGGDSGPQAIVLGAYRDEAVARRRLDELAARGVRTARVVTRTRDNAESEAHVRFAGRAAAAAVRELLAWAQERPGVTVQDEATCRE